MKNNLIWLVISVIMVLSLVAASCAPQTTATQTTTAPTTSAPTTSTTTQPTTSTTTTPTTTAGPEMASVSLKKLDGTTLTKQVEKPKYGGELILVRPSAIQAWDQGYVSHWTGAGWLSIYQEELLEGEWTRGAEGTGEATWQLGMWFDINYQRGLLAESWEFQQPDTIVFHLRKGVHWALNPALEASKLVNGRELTADDVVWNIKRLYFDLKAGPTYGVTGTSRPVDVYATDKNTVVVKAPPGQIWATHEYVSAWTRLSPPEIVAKYGDATQWDKAVGTGPYMVKDYVPMSAAIYVKNPNYWQNDPFFPDNKLPYIDTVKQLIIPDPSTRLAAMRTGQIDELGGLTMEEADSLSKTNPELKSAKFGYGTTPLLAGRVDKPDLPFKDIRVRRALTMAIDMQKIKDTFYGGQAEIFAYPLAPTPEWSRSFVPLDQIGLAPDGFDTKTIYQYNPDKARQLLTEAGYPNGFKTEVVVSGTSTVYGVDLLSIVKDYWSKIGVDLALDVKEAGVYTTMQNKKTHNQMMIYGYTSPALPQGMWTARSGNAYNMAMVSDPKIEEFYARISEVEPRSDEWWKRLKEQSLYQVHQIYYIPTPWPKQWRFWQPWLKRYYGESEIGLSNTYGWVKNTWIDQELKKATGH